MLTLSESFHDKGEGQQTGEDDLLFFEAREDAPEGLESAEETLDLIVFLVKSVIVFPRPDAVRLGGNDMNHAQLEHQLPGFAAFIGAVHQHRQAVGRTQKKDCWQN